MWATITLSMDAWANRTGGPGLRALLSSARSARRYSSIPGSSGAWGISALPLLWALVVGSALKVAARPDCGVVGISPQLTRMPAELLAKLLGGTQRHRSPLPGAVERPRGGRAGGEQVLHRDATPVGALGDRLDQRRGG